MSITRTLLGMPGGGALVVLTGLAVAGVGVSSIWSGWSRDFLVDLERHPGRLVVLGVVGFGVAFTLVGLLFLGAARTRHSEAATGLDGALRSLQGAPLGRYELAVVSVGLVSFGAYLVATARHLRR